MKKQNLTGFPQRGFYLAASAVLLAVEVMIALFVRDSFVRPYVGDALVVVLIYALVRVALPRRPVLLPLYVFCFAVCVEAAQHFDIVSLLGLEDIAFFRILIGTTFSPADILCYAAGCTLTAIWELWLHLKIRKKA